MLPEKLLALPSVEEMVGFKKTKIYALIEKGEFPRNRSIKGKSVWLQSEIQKWINDQWQAAS